MINMLLYKNNEFEKFNSKTKNVISDVEWIVWATCRIIFCIRYSRLFWIYLKKHEAVADNPSIMIYVNKIENRIVSKIKAGYYFELLILETMNLLGSIKS